MITNKKHNQIIEHKDKTISDYLAKILKLEQELKETRDLKLILEKFSGILTYGGTGIVYNHSSGVFDLSLPDNVLVYVDDILGGKVIKQEATKCLVVDEKGNVTTGLTKQKPDKGYSYKLLRKS